MKHTINLSKAQETLLITLYCKAIPNPIFFDPSAQQAIQQINYDFQNLKVPAQTKVTVRMRSKQMDAYAERFIKEHPEATIIHLGCGLDSRRIRLDNGSIRWFDLDLPDVIELRRQLFSEDQRYTMISASAAELTWLGKIPPEAKSVMVIAEGLFMYLTEQEVRTLIVSLSEQFPGCHLVCDVFSELTASRVERHRSLKITGATIRWGIDNAEIIENWRAGIHLEEEWFFSQSEDINKLGIFFQLAFKSAGLFPIVQKAHRLLYFTL